MIQKIEAWAEERELFKNPKPIKQLLKTHEEINELLNAIEDEKRAEIQDAIGDIAVTLIIYAKMKSLDIDVEGVSSELDSIPVVHSTDVILDQWNELFYLEKQEYGDRYSRRNKVNNIIANLNYIGNHYGMKFKDCLESAYNEIKDRKGKLVNGTFVKQ